MGYRSVQIAALLAALPTYAGVAHIIRFVTFGNLEPLIWVYVLYVLVTVGVIVAFLQRWPGSWWASVALAILGLLAGAVLTWQFARQMVQIQEIKWGPFSALVAFQVVFLFSYLGALVLLILPSTRKQRRARA